MIGTWKKIIDDRGVFGALLTDLSKLEAHGFLIDAYDYLSKRKQRVKVNGAYSSWKDKIYCVSQRSILSPLLFNIHFCDLFYFSEDLDIASYADDTTVYAINEKK